MKKSIMLPYVIFILIIILTSMFLSPTASLAIDIQTISLTQIIPTSVVNNTASTLTIIGVDFQDGASITLNGYGSISTSFVNTTTLTAILPAGVPAGIYTITVTNPDTSFASLTNAITVIAPTATLAVPTATVQPIGSYERPVIVIYSYGADQQTLSPGGQFNLKVLLYNAGQKYATNVVATFTAGEITPLGSGGVIAVGGIAPDNRSELNQQLSISYEAWGKSIVSIDMLVNYTDELGTPYSEKFNLTFPLFTPSVTKPTQTPTATTTPSTLYRPQLVVTDYETSVSPLQPGIQFDLKVTIQNVGNVEAKQITMIVGGGSTSTTNIDGTPAPGGIDGASGEFTTFAPLGSSNVKSIGNLHPNAILEESQSLIVNVSTNPGAYPLKLTFIFVDDKNVKYTDDQVITLLVYVIPKVDINFYQDPGIFTVGQPGLLPLQIVNLGKSTVVLGNMIVAAENAQLTNNVIFIGPLEPGGFFPLDSSIIPEIAGTIPLNITVDYTDDFNQLQIISQTLTIEAIEMSEPLPPGPGEDGDSGIPPEPTSETIWEKIVRFFRGLFGLDSSPPVDTSEPIPLEGENTGEEIPVSPPLKGP